MPLLTSTGCSYSPCSARTEAIVEKIWKGQKLTDVNSTGKKSNLILGRTTLIEENIYTTHRIHHTSLAWLASFASDGADGPSWADLFLKIILAFPSKPGFFPDSSPEHVRELFVPLPARLSLPCRGLWIFSTVSTPAGCSPRTYVWILFMVWWLLYFVDPHTN